MAKRKQQSDPWGMDREYPSRGYKVRSLLPENSSGSFSVVAFCTSRDADTHSVSSRQRRASPWTSSCNKFRLGSKTSGTVSASPLYTEKCDSVPPGTFPDRDRRE